jgi:hypothetical protein
MLAQNQANTVPANSPERENIEENRAFAERGEAREKVAKALGVSRRKAVEAKIVADRIDSLKNQGQEEEAERLGESDRLGGAAARPSPGGPEEVCHRPAAPGPGEFAGTGKHRRKR